MIGDGTERISYFDLPQSEALVVNSVNEFELALILMKKKLGRSLLTESILSRIQEKKIYSHNVMVKIRFAWLVILNWIIGTVLKLQVRKFAIVALEEYPL